MLYVALLTGLATITQADAAAAEGLAPQVRQLVTKLNSMQLGEREAAERGLIELGPGVLDVLPPAGRLPAEVRNRLDRVRRTLEQQRAEAVVQGATVTLPRARRPLSEYFAALQGSTGNPIVDYRGQFGQPAADPVLELGFEKTTFWQALDEVLDAAEMTVYPYAGESAVAVVGCSGGEAKRTSGVAYVGAFRIEPVELLARRDLRHDNLHTLQLRLEVGWEPRLEPIAIRQPLDSLTLTDVAGNVLPKPGDAVIEANVRQGSMSAELVLSLVPPPRQVSKIAKLTGRLDVLVPGGLEEFRFEGLAGAQQVEQSRAGVTVTLDRVRKNNEIWEVRTFIRFDQSGDALASHRGWIFNNEAYLEGPDGELTAISGFETLRQTENEVGIAYLFDVESLDGQAFVYKTPAAILEVPIRYELTDLELP